MRYFIDILKDIIAPHYYKLNPQIFGRGYERYKHQLINKLIEGKKINQITYIDERIVEIPWIIKEIKNKKGNLLDAGSSLNFYKFLSYLKKFDKIFITTLFPENNFYNKLKISYTYEDISNLSFKDKFFDVVTCVSTLEHIGYDNKIYNHGNHKNFQKKKNHLNLVLKNLYRVLKKKGVLLITVPYGKYGSYQNMQQFDEKALKKIFKILNARKVLVEYYKATKNKWTKTNKFLCKNIEPNFKIDKKNKIVLSANSVALIKIVK